MRYNFQSRKQILTLRGVYNEKIMQRNMQCEACHEALEGGRGGARLR